MSVRQGTSIAPRTGGRLPRSWAKVAVIGPIAALVLMIYVHVTSKRSPVSSVMSNYALAPSTAGPFVMSVLSMAGALGALAVCLHRLEPRMFGRVRTALGASAAAFVLAAIFPTDPLPGVHSANGFIHRYAAGAAFVAVAVAGVLLVRKLRSLPDWRRVARRLRTVTAICWIGIGIFALSHIPVLFPGTAAAEFLSFLPQRGLVQRLLLLTEIGMVLVVSFPMFTAARRLAKGRTLAMAA